jgi:serine/threonine-protein kinase
MPLTLDQLQTLDRLLQQALDLPLDERSQWIDTLPLPQAGLAPLLRAHLLVDEKAGAETADFLGALPVLPSLADRTGEPVAGERIGPYRLIRPLGEGGMSSVWLAERVDGTIRREVALKLPHRHLLDRGLAARMQRERDILAALNHDHIARLYDAGVDDDGRPYLAIEYVLGSPINLYGDEKNLGLDTRIRLMVQVARAVAHAHANLIVHRDLKPSNILVSEGDGASRVKLLDFGIAKLLVNDESATQAADLTQVLGRALTPDYASPEQLREQPVTTASDIYSLGVVLYEVVTGEKPYKLKRQSAAALAEAVINADVVRPAKRAAQGKHQREAKRIEGDLDAIIMKALKVAPEDRYATASALADDLERFLARQPVLARPDSWVYRTRRFVQRHALAVGAGAAVSIALIAGAAVAIWQAREARLETAKTRAVKDFLLSIITVGNVDQQDAMARRKQPIGDVLLDAAKTMPQKFADQPEIRAEIQGLLGTALADLNLNDSAKALRETRLAELKARSAPRPERMQAQVDLATMLIEGTDAKRGMQLFDEVIATLDNSSDRHERLTLAEALRATSMTKMLRSDGSGEGVRDAERALAIVEALEPNSRNHASTLSILGFAHGHNRDLPKAEAAFERAIAIAKMLPASERAYEGMVRLRYAEILIPRRYHQRALQQFTEALAVIEQTGGRDSFRWARTAVVMANLVSVQGDAPRAFELYEQVLKVYARFGDELHPGFANTGQALYGANLADYGRVADGLAMTRRAYAPYRDENSKFGASATHWTAGTRYALVLQMTGDYAEADRVLNQALRISRARGVSRAYSDLTTGERLLALNDFHRGEYAKAETMLKEIIEVDGAPKDRFVSQRNFSRLALVRVYLAQERLADAEAELSVIGKIIENVATDEVAISRPAAAELARLRGALALKRGDAATAETQFRNAIDILKARSDANSPLLATARAELGLALLARGQRTEARQLAEEVRRAFASHAALAPHFTRVPADLERKLGR